MKIIIVEKILSDECMSSKEGEHIDENYYKQDGCRIIKEDCDVYIKDHINGGKKLLLKLRKNVISEDLTRTAKEAYVSASKKKHENRGAAAGILNRDKLANYIGDMVNPGKFRTKFISSYSGKPSKQATSNLSQSNIVGFFDIPDRNLKGKGAPCRLTAYNRDYPDLWTKSLPFLLKCNELFEQLIPTKHAIQYERAQQTPEFVIPKTAFSTVTINYSWRTALHRDAGDLRDGFGNLVVIEDDDNPNTYTGCYLGFPQYGVAVDVRNGDFLAMDVHEWHCNTEFIPNNKEFISNNEVTKKFKEKDIINDWYFNRLSMVMYLRENMLKCKNKALWKNK